MSSRVSSRCTIWKNVGDTKMAFVAVELKKESANFPLSLFEGQPMPRPEAIDTSRHADSFRSGELTTSNFRDWSDAIRLEFKNNEFNGRIGTDLVFENSSVRVWHMTLKPGERMPVHRHVLTYLWTAITQGVSCSGPMTGRPTKATTTPGLTHFYDVGEGEFALHNLENVGDTTMVFCAVELKRESANQPLPL